MVLERLLVFVLTNFSKFLKLPFCRDLLFVDFDFVLINSPSVFIPHILKHLVIKKNGRKLLKNDQN